MHIIHANLARGFRGGERQTVLLIQALAHKAGVTHQTLVCRPDSPLRDELAATPGVSFVRASHQLAGHRRAGRATLVHAHEARAVHWAWLHRWLYRTPYLITRRVDTPVKPKRSNLVFYRDAFCCVALSRAIADEIQPLSPRPVVQIPSAFTPLPSLSGAPIDDAARAFRGDYPGCFLVGHAGALVDRHKGQRVLLEAARRLQHTQPDMRFVFFGRGEDEAALKRESADLGNVIWAGFRPDIGSYLPALDVFAFPSRNEGLGSVLLDAMQARLPVVASRVGGIPDIVRDEDTGLLFPPGDADALADCLTRLRNPALRRALTERASARLADYSPEAMADAYLALYDRPVPHRPTRGSRP